MYNRLYNNLFKVIFYNKNTCEISLAPIEISLRLIPGVYDATDKDLEKLDEINIRTIFVKEEMYQNFVSITKWTKPTLNKTEILMISKQLSETLLSGMFNTKVVIDKDLKLYGIKNIYNDIATICLAYTYKLITEIIASDKAEISEQDIEILNNILTQASQMYKTNTQQELFVFSSTVKYVKIILDQFISPYIRMNVNTVNNIPVNINISNIDSLRVECKQILLSDTLDSHSFEDYSQLSNILLPHLCKNNTLIDLINSIYRYQYPSKNISGLFGMSEEDKYIKSLVESSISYFKSRVQKLRQKELTKSQSNLINYEKTVKSKIEDFINDNENKYDFSINNFYDYNKRTLLISNSFGVAYDANNLQKLINLFNEIKSNMISFLGKDITQSNSDQSSNYIEFYISTISKARLEILKVEDKYMYELKYTTPYVNDYQDELVWTK